MTSTRVAKGPCTVIDSPEEVVALAKSPPRSPTKRRHGGVAAALKLSARCSSSSAVPRVIDVSKPSTIFGRAPQCDVILDSERVPAMISRIHARLQRIEGSGEAACRWLLTDDRSMNGILVNDVRVRVSQFLASGDIVVFGKRVDPPEFEFVFEINGDCPTSPAKVARPVLGASASSAARPTPGAEELEQLLESGLRRIEEQRRKVDAERQSLEQEKEEHRRRAEKEELEAQRTALDVAELHSELACAVCQDWLVHAATLRCAHAFCWRCIDDWLLKGHFECPVCRGHVAQEPCRSRALDAVVRKAVGRCVEQEREEYEGRCKAADELMNRRQAEKVKLDESVRKALQDGKDFFQIDGKWSPKQRNTFSDGIRGYAGECREAYCRLTGLTVQWIHGANGTSLQRACSNLGVKLPDGGGEEQIRQRLLMFLRYG